MMHVPANEKAVSLNLHRYTAAAVGRHPVTHSVRQNASR
jgi:hypothetical protein